MSRESYELQVTQQNDKLVYGGQSAFGEENLSLRKS